MSDSPGSTPTPTRASRPALDPGVGLRELLVAELDAGPLVRRLGMRVRQRHRHVEVVGAGREGALEDRHHEARVDRVEDVGDAVLATQGRDVLGPRRVDPRGDEPVVAGEPGDGPLRAAGVVVGHDHPLEEVAARGDRDDRTPDATGADDEDPHPTASWLCDRRWSIASLADAGAAPSAPLRGAGGQPPAANFQSMVPVKQCSSFEQAP